MHENNSKDACNSSNTIYSRAPAYNLGACNRRGACNSRSACKIRDFWSRRDTATARSTARQGHKQHKYEEGRLKMQGQKVRQRTTNFNISRVNSKAARSLQQQSRDTSISRDAAKEETTASVGTFATTWIPETAGAP